MGDRIETPRKGSSPICSKRLVIMTWPGAKTTGHNDLVRRFEFGPARGHNEWGRRFEFGPAGVILLAPSAAAGLSAPRAASSKWQWRLLQAGGIGAIADAYTIG